MIIKDNTYIYIIHASWKHQPAEPRAEMGFTQAHTAAVDVLMYKV